MLQTSIFDILAPYLVSLVIIVSTVIVAWLVNTMIKHYLHKREGAKKSKIVDIILKNLHPSTFSSSSLALIMLSWFCPLLQGRYFQTSMHGLKPSSS